MQMNSGHTSMSDVLKRGDIWKVKGVWMERHLQDPGGVKESAAVSCPKCGEVCSLTEHSVAADGTVSPSLVCPFNCGYHAMVKLQGWKR